MTPPRPRLVRLLKPWRLWSRGHVFTEMGGAQARDIIRTGHAEYVTEDVPTAPVDRIMRSAARPRRVRDSEV
jgi:hypothetical protein